MFLLDRRYRKFEKMMERPDFDVFSFVHELELHQGFGEPSALCESRDNSRFQSPYMNRS